MSSEPLIVYMSNMFAMLGLRAMYFLLADAIRRFDLLKYALALILVFVGLKMTVLLSYSAASSRSNGHLAIIATLLGGAVLMSVFRGQRGRDPRKKPKPGGAPAEDYVTRSRSA